MLRIIDGQTYEGKPSPDRWKITMHDLGHGHREACVQRCYDWEHIGSTRHVDVFGLDIGPVGLTDEEIEEKRLANLKRAARRAKANVRRRCKVQGLDTLLTLTYKANQTDPVLADAHLKEFLRRMRTQIKNFCYVAMREPQKRGAWHWHLAVRKLPALLEAKNGVKVKSWMIVRAIWRAVVGDLGGNIDEARRKGTSRKSAAKCASYISKYALKLFETGEKDSKRYRASQCDVPAPTSIELRTNSLADLVDLVTTGFAFEHGRGVATVFLSRFKDVFFVATEVG